LSSRAEPSPLGAGGSAGSSALEELLLLELLELELLDAEPGIGGAEPGNGNWSPAEECLPAGAGASGVCVEPAEGEVRGSPGNGKRSEVGVGEQVAGDDLSRFLFCSPVGAVVPV